MPGAPSVCCGVPISASQCVPPWQVCAAGSSLWDAPDNLDPSFVQAALRLNGMAVRYVSGCILAHHAVALAAVTQNGVTTALHQALLRLTLSLLCSFVLSRTASSLLCLLLPLGMPFIETSVHRDGGLTIGDHRSCVASPSARAAHQQDRRACSC